MIKILPKEITEKIAAGEVIESPLSAIKELVENSIDAGSSKISVEIEDGGRRLIEITDNGSGMKEEDLKLAVMRFATSKISNFEDLYGLTTLGFRGEALPSIGAVSRMEIETKAKDEFVGHYIIIEGGRIIKSGDKPAADGTRIKVSSLFFNTPARLKFLKSHQSEVVKILNYLFRLSLHYSLIHFKLINAKKEALNLLPNTGVPHKIQKLWNVPDNDFIQLNNDTLPLKINGFTSLPKTNKVNRIYQIFFLNGRLIKSPLISQAVTEAYREFMEKGRFPLTVLFLNIDGAMVDVNVHPTKSQVKFQDDRQVFRIVNKTIRNALYKIRENKNFEGGNVQSLPFSEGFKNIEFKEESSFIKTHVMPLAFSKQDVSLEKTNESAHKFLQFRNSYIITLSEDELWIIDQHAASEKLTYEKFKKMTLAPQEVFFQRLLTPKIIELTARQLNVYKEVSPYLEFLGFQTEPFEGSSILIRTVLENTKIGEIESIIIDTLDELSETSSQTKINLKEKFLQSLACRSSIRAGQKLAEEEMSFIFEEIIKNSRYNFCPHGRPIFLKFDMKLLNKLFKRTQ